MSYLRPSLKALAVAGLGSLAGYGGYRYYNRFKKREGFIRRILGSIGRGSVATYRVATYPARKVFGALYSGL